MLVECIFFVKQKQAYGMRISDWSSDVCSSDLRPRRGCTHPVRGDARPAHARGAAQRGHRPRDRRTLGKLSADLFAGGHDQLRRAVEQTVEHHPLSRLIVISNRVSAPQPEQPASQGGLAVALTAALRESDGIWFGWSGDIGARHDLQFETYGGVTPGQLALPRRVTTE